MRRSIAAMEVELSRLADLIEEHPNAIHVDFERKQLSKQEDVLEGTAYFTCRILNTDELEVGQELKRHWNTGLRDVFYNAVARELGTPEYGMSMGTVSWRELYVPVYHVGVDFSFVTEAVIDEHD